ncbi:MAG: trimethylamine methyltransferase family protein [Bacillota bacterium]
MQYINKKGHNLQFQVLPEQGREKIHSTVLETLQDVGVVVQSNRHLEMLKHAGATVSENRAYISHKMVEEALQGVPNGFCLYDRKDESRLEFAGKKFNFGPGPSTTHTVDPYTGERRFPRKEDTRNAARIMDALENIDFVMDFGTIQDVPIKYADLHLLQAILENTTKPVLHWGFNVQNCRTVIEICKAVSGSLEKLQKRPFLAFFTCSNSPLLHTEESLDKLTYASQMNLPVVYVSAPTAGSTTPVTLAGTLVVTLTECLSGLVIHQLSREGSPFAMGGVTGATDMKTMLMSYGCPEFNLMHAALAEMAHYYDLPLWGSAGCTDAKTVDQQAAVEATASIIMSAMSGTNIIHDVGYTEGGNCSNPSMLVMSDEIIGYTKRLIEGIRIDEISLALEAIKRVGPMGEFMTDEHTYNNFKEELWVPGLMDRSSYQNWSANGRLTMGEKAEARVRELIESHEPRTLDPETAGQIRKIVQEASGM